MYSKLKMSKVFVIFNSIFFNISGREEYELQHCAPVTNKQQQQTFGGKEQKAVKTNPK